MLLGLLVGRVKAIFRIPKEAERSVFGEELARPRPLAYIELFTKPSGEAAPYHHGYHAVKPDYYGPTQAYPTRVKKAIVLPVDMIVSSCQLVPKFQGRVNRRWTFENILDVCSEFFVNNHLSAEMFKRVF